MTSTESGVFPTGISFSPQTFTQLTFRESLRGIETCLRALGGKLYHLWIRGHISRSTLAGANQTCDWRIFADLAQVLIATARPLYAGDPLGVEPEETAYALDCTTIDLCLSLFVWVHYRRLNAAVKMHTLLNLRGSIPVGLDIKPAKIWEIRVFDHLLPEPGAFYLLDRGYLDFARLYTLTHAWRFSTIRARKYLRLRCGASQAVDKSAALRCDQTIRLVSFYPLHCYPEHLRRIRYCDRETHRHLTFLTNNFSLPTLTIPQLYKRRWQVELFFKWVKQHLRIKAFYGLSECREDANLEGHHRLRRVSTTLRQVVTEFSEFFHVIRTGLLIQTSLGRAGGLGALRTKRSG